MPMTSSVVKQVVSQLTESPVTPGPMPGIVGALLKEGVISALGSNPAAAVDYAVPWGVFTQMMQSLTYSLSGSRHTDQ